LVASLQYSLRGASLPVVGPGALCPCLRFGHVAALLGLAIPARARAVVDLAGGIHPNLTGTTGSRSSAFCRRRLRARLRWCVCGTGRLAPRLYSPVAATGARPLRPAKGGAVFAGGGDRGGTLRVSGSQRQHKPGDHGDREQKVSHQTHPLSTMLTIEINLRKRFAQPISISLALPVGCGRRLRSTDPIQDPQPCRRN
jgi:hypothetical protein